MCVCLSPSILAAGSAKLCPNRASGLYKRPAPLPIYFFLTPEGEHSATLGHVYEGILLINFSVSVARWALQTFATEVRGLDHELHNHSSEECDLGLQTRFKLFKSFLCQASLELTSWPETPHHSHKTKRFRVREPSGKGQTFSLLTWDAACNFRRACTRRGPRRRAASRSGEEAGR